MKANTTASDALLSFLDVQLDSWITKLRETQARNGQELDPRVEKTACCSGELSA